VYIFLATRHSTRLGKPPQLSFLRSVPNSKVRVAPLKPRYPAKQIFGAPRRFAVGRLEVTRKVAVSLAHLQTTFLPHRQYHVTIQQTWLTLLPAEEALATAVVAIEDEVTAEAVAVVVVEARLRRRNGSQ
jgi:hypothetical protein